MEKRESRTSHGLAAESGCRRLETHSGYLPAWPAVRRLGRNDLPRPGGSPPGSSPDSPVDHPPEPPPGSSEDASPDALGDSPVNAPRDAPGSPPVESPGGIPVESPADAPPESPGDSPPGCPPDSPGDCLRACLARRRPGASVRKRRQRRRACGTYRARTGRMIQKQRRPGGRSCTAICYLLSFDHELLRGRVAIRGQLHEVYTRREVAQVKRCRTGAAGAERPRHNGPARYVVDIQHHHT